MDIDFDIPEVFSPLFEPYRFKVFASGRGAAKSWAFARVLLLLSLRSKDLFILCCREVQKSIEDSVHALLKDQIKTLNLSGFFDVTATTITARPTGSRFRFKGLFNERAADTVKSLEGANYCWVEEAQTISENSLEVLIPTIREQESEIWFSLNPRFKEDAVWQMFFANEAPPGSCVKKISWRDNPFFPDVLSQQLRHDKQVSNARYLHVWEGALKSAAGNLIKREWWARWDPLNKPVYALRFVAADTAFSEKTTADFSVLQLWGITADGQNLDLLDSWAGRWNYPTLLANTKTFYETHKTSDSAAPLGALVVEKKASGQSLLQSLDYEGFDVHPFDPGDMDKVRRVNAVIPAIFHKRIRIPPDEYKDWVEPFIAECAAFSDDMSHPHDDQVDAMTSAVLVWYETAG